MKRRDFITLLGGAAAAGRLRRAAQQTERMPAIGSSRSILRNGKEKNIGAFVDGLRVLGYVAGQNVDIDYRYAEGDTTRLKPLAQELIALKPDVALAIRRARRLRPKRRRACQSFARRSAISSCRASWRTSAAGW